MAAHRAAIVIGRRPGQSPREHTAGCHPAILFSSQGPGEIKKKVPVLVLASGHGHFPSATLVPIVHVPPVLDSLVSEHLFPEAAQERKSSWRPRRVRESEE